MKMKEDTIFLVVLTFAFFGVSSGERKLIRLDEEQRLADQGTQWKILISNFLLNIYLVQLIKHPILRIPNISFVYFLSIFSR